MNLIKELETILKAPNFMGERDKTGVNLAVNAILYRLDELGLEIVEKTDMANLERQISDQSDIINIYRELTENKIK